MRNLNCFERIAERVFFAFFRPPHPRRTPGELSPVVKLPPADSRIPPTTAHRADARSVLQDQSRDARRDRGGHQTTGRGVPRQTAEV